MSTNAVKVGAAARAAGVKVQTLHYYERRGLLRPRGRSAAGYREYGEPEVRRVRGIRRAQALGFSLREITELLAIAEGGRPVREVSELAHRKLLEIDARIRDLDRMRDCLTEAIETCACGGDLARCQVIEGLAGEAPV